MTGTLSMQVYKGRWNGILVAVKALNSNAEEVEDDLQREAVILSKLRHPHIVKFLGLFRDTNDKVLFHFSLQVSCSHCALTMHVEASCCTYSI